MTIREVAAIAGVSPAAVSRYLNGGSLSEAKRAQIRRAIEETGYHPSAAGQMLRTGRINQIGVIVPQINSESVGEVTAGVAEKLASSKYVMILGSCALNEETELEYLQSMQANHVAGIILMGTAYSPSHAEAFQRCRVPLVVTGQKFPGVHCVYHDDFGAARELAGHMIARGHRHLGYIGVNEEDPAVGLERRRGVQAAMEEAGMDPEGLARVAGTFDPKTGETGLLQLIRQDPSMNGIICATDKIALTTMQALKRLGRRIPEDCAVAGFDDNWAGTLSEPKLTTVHFYQKQCGTEAAAMMLDLLNNGAQTPVRQTKLGYTLVERNSI